MSADNGRRRVVVTGLGMVTPLGNDVETTWSNLIAGKSGAAEIEQFDAVDTISGEVSFSDDLHSVFGRQYRVIKIQNNKPSYVGSVRAKVVPNI